MQHNPEKPQCDVIVTYCWNRVGYNILRSLSARGLRVCVADTSRTNICSVSRHKAGSFTYPDPFAHEEEFIASLLRWVAALRPRVLLPTHDEGIIIAKHRNRFPKELIIPIASHDLLVSISDKAFATEIAREVGVPTPEVYPTADDIAQYPVVFKTVVGNSAKGVYFPASRAELLALQTKHSDEKTLIQQKVSGTDYSVDCVRGGDGYFQASVYKALITKTEGGGTTTQRIIADQPKLIEYAKRILDHIGYHGVCGLDFKHDEATGETAFIEVNARFTGGLATPIAAGFDIPAILYALATHQALPARQEARVGTQTKWILGDIITLVGRLVHLKCSWREIRDVLRLRGFDSFDDFYADDRRAIFGEMLYYFLKLVKNGKLNP